MSSNFYTEDQIDEFKAAAIAERKQEREGLRKLEARHEAKVAAMHAAIEEQATQGRSYYPYELSDPQTGTTK